MRQLITAIIIALVFSLAFSACYNPDNDPSVKKVMVQRAYKFLGGYVPMDSALEIYYVDTMYQIGDAVEIHFDKYIIKKD